MSAGFRFGTVCLGRGRTLQTMSSMMDLHGSNAGRLDSNATQDVWRGRTGDGRVPARQNGSKELQYATRRGGAGTSRTRPHTTT